ncbi:amidase [Paracraurococcus lichenis]|uniref:Amidase family protein n=1 Tax=Paracraurococcus lichenis TaxID=3064888 RepID=A0ABT9E0I6_9PROT|nr:amidase family protein [Paracraurococcus sp. LOR1-02]MDO9709682.1 amidase family protein [Paracraurococcus sp. LOR1-02]
MDRDEIGWLGVAELGALYRARQLSPVEVVQAILARIERIDPQMNAMMRVTPEHALAAARRSEAVFREGGTPRLLEGIPVTIKDLQPTKGVQTDYASAVMQGTIPDADAPVVTRLLEAGGMMLGKTTSAAEWGWKGVSQAPISGITHNPWGRGLNAGASSSGAGVAAACGYGPLHQGGDGAGSVRMPAHFSGVYGLKPTYGRVPNWPMSNNDLATHIGPLTRSVADAAVMLQAIAGPHPADFTSLEAPPQDYAARLGAASMKGKRIAYTRDLGHARVDPEVAELVEKAVTAFEAMGAHVEEVTPAWGKLGPELVRFFWPATFTARLRYLPEFESRMDPGFVAMIRSAADWTVPQFMQMRERRFAYIEAIHAFMQDWDFLLSPAVSVAAFPADRLQPEHWPQHPWDWLMWAEFSYPFNWSGSPAASVPCGFTPAGLPVGLQIVGRRFDDLGVLQASAAFEAARPWAQHLPPVAG